MVTWIVLGVVLLGLLILALAVRVVLVRLLGLRRAVLTMLRRQAEAEALAASALALRERILTVQSGAELAQRTAAVVRVRRARD